MPWADDASLFYEAAAREGEELQAAVRAVARAGRRANRVPDPDLRLLRSWQTISLGKLSCPGTTAKKHPPRKKNQRNNLHQPGKATATAAMLRLPYLPLERKGRNTKRN